MNIQKWRSVPSANVEEYNQHANYVHSAIIYASALFVAGSCMHALGFLLALPIDLFFWGASAPLDPRGFSFECYLLLLGHSPIQAPSKQLLFIQICCYKVKE